MGISVDKSKLVRYTPNNNNLIDSSQHGKPVVQSVYGFEVTSIFRRVKSKTKNVSDGNPLIYALKSLGGYRVETETIKSFLKDFHQILELIGEARFKSSLIIALPSKSSINAQFAKRVSRHFGIPVRENAISKKYNRAVCEDFDMILSSDIAKNIKSELRGVRASLSKSLSLEFSMKQIPTNLRKYFSPFLPTCPIDTGEKVLLVDDVLSTGSSFRHARDLVMAQGATVECLCLFSSTGPNKPTPTNANETKARTC